ncbi:MAG: hypothetical protein JXN64_07610 [Spirochaetes bacterium]|nr:hypothetical protein [Spirochaetota bacterium]
MKKTMIMLMVAIIALSGCSKKSLTEKEFSILWQEYLRREFEESFDEKQSISQREKILAELLSANNFTIEEFKAFMKKNHNDKYNKIFVE